MSEYQLAQLNIGNPAYPLDSPELKDFIDNLDLINSLAERSDGFVWRLQTPAGNATEVDAAVFKNYGDNTIVNMSTWSDAESLKHFVYKTVHARFLKRRAEWFTEMKSYAVLWWVPEGTIPTLDEAHAKLQLLEKQGPTPDAFSLNQTFGPGPV